MTAEMQQRPAEEVVAGILDDAAAWAARPIHARALRRLAAVLAVARRQLHDLPSTPQLAQDPALELWRLREPGFLRDLVEQPPVRVSGVRIMLPVLATWALLGFFEWRHIARQAGVDPAERTPFFTEWMNNPWYLSPVGLSAVVVASVLTVMVGYWRASAAQRLQEQLEKRAEDVEVELLAPLAQLREQGLSGSPDVAQQVAAEAVWAAARELRGAAENLGGSVGAAADLRVVLDRLLDRLPEVGEQAVRLGGLTEKFEQAAGFVVQETRPLVELVQEAGIAAATLRQAMTTAVEMVDRAREMSAEVNRSVGVADHSQEPLVVASEQVRTATERMELIMRSLESVAGTLNEAMQRASWISLVADGLRSGEYDASGHNGGSRAPA